MDVERATLQLAVIVEVADLAEELGIEIRLCGGWAMDFFIGELTRDSEDADWSAAATDLA